MIVGTAGHIDHGKTVLLRALTGIEGDRRPAERERGITIDLGYVYAPLDGDELTGFIDVPGHERFVHNMLAGACGIDLVLLLVAADDGVMPQTREHLAIVELLGIRRALVALSKIDRVGPEIESVAGPGAVAEMIEHFGQDMPDRIQRMKALLASGELVLLARLAHDLKSNSATLGIPVLSELGKRIEAAAEGRSDEAIAPLIQEVEALLPRVLMLLEDRGSSFTG